MYLQACCSLVAYVVFGFLSLLDSGHDLLLKTEESQSSDMHFFAIGKAVVSA
jgi:hypothetical protein